MRKSICFMVAAFALLQASCGMAQNKSGKFPDPKIANSKTVYSVKLTDEEWKKRLTPEQFNILREEGTERQAPVSTIIFMKRELIIPQLPCSPFLVRKTNSIQVPVGRAFMRQSLLMQFTL